MSNHDPYSDRKRRSDFIPASEFRGQTGLGLRTNDGAGVLLVGKFQSGLTTNLEPFAKMNEP